MIQTIAVGEQHLYTVTLEPGDFIELTLDQSGDNMDLVLRDPMERVVLEVDTPSGPYSRERLFAIAETAGEHGVEVVLQGQVGGEYRLSLETRRATAGDRMRARACRLLYKGWLAGDLEEEALAEAEAEAEEALALWRQLGDGYLETVAQIRLGRLHLGRGELEEAEGRFSAARERAESLELRDLLPEILLGSGQTLVEEGRPEDAESAFREALVAATGVEDRWRVGVVCNELGRFLYDHRRNARETLDLLSQAVDVFSELSDDGQKAHALHNRGRMLLWLGREDDALRDLEEALELKQGDNGESVAKTLLEIGWIHLGMGDEAGAEERILFALELAGGNHHAKLTASCLDRLGTLYRRQRRLPEAREVYRHALQGFRELEDQGNEAHALNNLGRIYVELGELDRAFVLLGKALDAFKELEDRSGRAYALANRAEASIRRDDLRSAIGDLDQALTLHEDLRSETGSPAIRATYLETVYDHFQRYIDLAMELETREAGKGWIVKALDAVERSRARSLLDLVSQLDLTRRPEDEPTEAGLAKPRKLEEIRGALDRDTGLLVFALGPQRSFVWLVGADKARWGILPSRMQIQQQVQSLVKALRSPPDALFQEESLDFELENLGEMLLGPLGLDSTSAPLPHRLVVIPDGPLHYLPFEALRYGKRYLQEDHEVVLLPSASVLVALRERRAAQPVPPPPGLLAVLADPVFEPDDDRLDAEAKERAQTAASGEGVALESLSRLRESANEADSVLSWVSEAPSTCRWDKRCFGASRDAMLSGRLEDFRLVHLATHAVLDDDSPERSRVVLSQFDQNGGIRPGAVYSYEIAGLELNADLVVLSACETALGEEIRGEGLVGFPQSFFEAGADRVLVTLWNVDDRATAKLMKRFYDGLLGEGLSPGEALRRAQAALRDVDGYVAPYYWAPFILIGDWAPLPSTLRASPCLKTQ